MPIWCKLDPDQPAIKVQSMTVRFGDGRVATTTNGFMTIGTDVVLPPTGRPATHVSNRGLDGQ